MYHKVQDLREKGFSYQEIAQEVGSCRRTVTNHAKMDLSQAQEYFEKGVQRKSEFDAYLDFICALFQKYPRIKRSNVYNQLKEHFKEIKSSDRAFRKYINKHRDKIMTQEVKIRHFEPVIDRIPGQQMQVDLGEENVVIAETKTLYKVYFVSFILCWSRIMYVFYETRPFNTEMFIKAHYEAFQFFEGVPYECIYDQTKLVVIREEYRELVLNDRFGKFALGSNFRVHACEGYDPQSKGMVEKSVDYIKQSFLHGREFQNIEDLRNRNLAWITDVANARVHGTTKKRPMDLFLEEKCSLQKLNGLCMDTENRESDKTGLINYKGLKYSVPFQYQSKRVKITVMEGVLYIYNESMTECIAEWDLQKNRELINKNNNHYRDYRKSISELRSETLPLLINHSILCAEKLLSAVEKASPRNPRDQFRGLKKLLFKYAPAIWDKSIDSIMSLPIVSCMRIEKILKETIKTQELASIEHILNKATKAVEQSDFRSLSYYDQIGQGVSK
jgi:predicted transcriptional regulator